ncbi:glycosyltransferase [Thermodesulfobacterium hveragerdense]|uniref:glycosyltransferase n=1 Tax=Thermodesulfobacterium hveragerdense TaxID=53424 RepID=UPI0003FFA5AA|nr:glycosyltransferase [Thermodesulfobacterium hveragerdense]
MVYRKESLIRRLEKLKEYRRDLLDLGELSFEDYMKTRWLHYSVERLLFLIAESILDIFDHILASKFQVISDSYVSPYLITVGRLTKPKAHWHLLRIFRELKKDFPDIKLLILGDGELKEYLTKLSEKLGLKTYVWDKSHPNEGYDVYFMGFRQNPFKYISRARLFVFPSLWEGFGNVLVEAMACGVPVVSSDCRSGPREILAPDTDYTFQTKVPEFAKFGVLMPVFEVKFLNTEPLTHEEATWVETIKQLLEDERLRESYSQKAKERALDFHIEKIVQEWRRVLHEILS